MKFNNRYYDTYKELAVEFIQVEGISNAEKALGIPMDVLKVLADSLELKEGNLFLKVYPSPTSNERETELYMGCTIVRQKEEFEEGFKLKRELYAKITNISRKNSFFNGIKKYAGMSVEMANLQYWMKNGKDMYDYCINMYKYYTRYKSQNQSSVMEHVSILKKICATSEEFEYMSNCFSYIMRLHKRINEYKENDQSFLRHYYTFQFVMRKAPYHTELWCKLQQEDALQNFDLNMNFFNSLSQEKFNCEIEQFCKKHSDFVEVENLNEYAIPGIYIMILDEYKQIYIGVAYESIKKRIMQHWSKKMPLDRLIFGGVKTSIVSIDSFRVYDTRRILAAPHPEYSNQTLGAKESNLIKTAFSSEFLLNRCAGGLHSLQEAVENSRQREKME